jgi:CBS domain-containing protein
MADLMQYVPRGQAGPSIAELMLEQPDTVPPETTVAAARAEFENPRHKLIVLADGDRYVGGVTRETVEGADDADALGGLDVTAAPTLAPDASSAAALELIDATGHTRIPVVGADGRLHGLVCFNRTHDAFCVNP